MQGTPLLQLFALCIRSRCISFFACSCKSNIFYSVCVCLTCPEWSGLPVLVVVCEAGEARHAAGVIVTQALQYLPQLLPALLFQQQPGLILLLSFPTETERIIKTIIMHTYVYIHSDTKTHLKGWTPPALYFLSLLLYLDL